jgi:transposase
MLVRGTKDKEHAMAEALNRSIAFAGIDIGKNSFHVVGLNERGAIVLRQKWSRGQVEARFANMPPCLIGPEVMVSHRQVRFTPSTGHRQRSRPRLKSAIFESGATVAPYRSFDYLGFEGQNKRKHR